jgi:hypothetical protein
MVNLLVVVIAILILLYFPVASLQLIMMLRNIPAHDRAEMPIRPVVHYWHMYGNVAAWISITVVITVFIFLPSLPVPSWIHGISAFNAIIFIWSSHYQEHRLPESG